MNIQPLDINSSKQEEFEALEKIASLFPNGTYLHDLFSEPLLGWVDGQIRNDFTTDIFENLISVQQERNNATKEIADLRRCIEQMEALVLKHETYAEQLEREVVATKEEAARDVKSYREAFEELSFQNDGLVSSNDQLTEEVKRLKIEVYDLTHKPMMVYTPSDKG